MIVPFHRNLQHLRDCLTGVRAASAALPGDIEIAEVLVVADGAVDDPGPLAKQHGARVISVRGPRGPAVARTRGAAAASGELLVFVDADVVVHEDAFRKLLGLFAADSDVGAAFGAYDERPADVGFFSQCRNLAHSFIHRGSNRDARTFWAGLGAVRKQVFEAVGGFDERFTHPSVEDIDLGYRISQAGFRIVLEPEIQGTHLKRWTLWSSIVSDIRDRGVPWTQLVNRYQAMRDDLNLQVRYRWAVVLSYMMLGCLAAAPWMPVLLGVALALALGLLWLDRSCYQFLAARRGPLFAMAWFPFHVIHHLCNGVSFALGTLLFVGRKWVGIALPWALPVTPWSARETR